MTSKKEVERRLEELEDDKDGGTQRVVIDEEIVDKNGDVVETNRKVIELGGD